MSWPDSTMSCKYVSLSAVTSLYLNSLTGVKSPILEKSVFSAQYLSIDFVFWCFGQTNKQTDLQTCIPLAFEAIASSSGDIQTLIDKIISQDHTIRQTKSESEESEAFDFDFQNY